MNILSLNAGSSSLKYKLYQVAPGTEELLAEGSAEQVQDEGTMAAARAAIGRCAPLGIDAIGHRVVHGGTRFIEPVLVDGAVLAGLRGLTELDPLHNPIEVAVIEAAGSLLPGIPMAAVFDTTFHATMPPIAYRYALPGDLSERLALRRYGFHGISHKFVSAELLACLGRDAPGTRLITCHLGSGASICAVRDGVSIDTSMGMTPLEGLVMGTRSGDIDPGLVLYLMRSQKMPADQIDDLLNHQSGLLGLSGISADVRQLQQAAAGGNAAAELALEIFAYRAGKYIGAYAVALEGLDAIAFAGGIGEHSLDMRHRICRRLAFMGIRLDDTLNAQASREPFRISAVGTLDVWVIPTDEERQIARETFALLMKHG